MGPFGVFKSSNVYILGGSTSNKKLRVTGKLGKNRILQRLWRMCDALITQLKESNVAEIDPPLLLGDLAALVLC